jgi:antitoxin component YwqK of YwqJK toxin-antitoxin module
MFKHFFSAFFFLGIIVFASCQNSKADTTTVRKEVQAYFPDSTIKTIWEFPVGDSSSILVTHFYHNQKVQMRGHIKNGARDGKWIAWDEDGKIQSTAFYVDGFEDGVYTVFYPDGRKRYEGTYDMGRRTGVWRFWDATGKLIKEVDYGKAPALNEEQDTLNESDSDTH